MRTRVLGAVAVLAVGLLMSLLPPTNLAPANLAAGATSVRLGVVGDLGQTVTTGAVLDRMHGRGVDASVLLGDLSYGDPLAWQAYCDFVTQRLGQGFPVELVAGNHESNGQNGHINDFAACLPNQLPGAVGTYGRQYYVDLPAEAPVMRVVLVSSNLTFPDGTYSYAKGSPRYQWTSDAIDGARARGIPWVVLGTHLNCLGVGNYTCPVGPDLVDLALDKRVDLLLTGHDHLYARSHLLGTGAACPTPTAGYDADCVVDSGTDGLYDTVDGTVLSTVGTGGYSNYDVTSTSPFLPYYAFTRGAAASPTSGYLELVVDSDRLSGSFITAGGETLDTFAKSRSLVTPLPPDAPGNLTATADATPAARLSWTHSGLRVDDFVVSRDGAPVATLPASARSYEDLAVTRSTTYSYSVVARSVVGSSAPATTSVTVPGIVPQVLVPTGSTWRWRFTASAAPPAGWQLPGTDVSSWSSGPAPLGYGAATYVRTNIDVPAGVTRPISAQFRRDITVADPSVLGSIQVTTHANDGVIVWVNGTEVGRSNLPTGPITWTSYATAAPSLTTALSRPVAFAVPPGLLVAGVNTVAVQTHLNYRATRDATMELELRSGSS